MSYSIIIPIHNEVQLLDQLLAELFSFSSENEIIIVDDGSTDGSHNILSNCSYINTIRIDNNYGKGNAIRTGIQNASFDKIILFDGDLEIETSEISNLMKVDPQLTPVVFGYRNENFYPLSSLMNFGNFFFIGLFNLIFQTQFRDILCGCKAFTKSALNLEKINSTQFDIDIELSGHFSKQKDLRILEVPLSYKRRNSEEGKKLKIQDGFTILRRLFNIK